MTEHFLVKCFLIGLSAASGVGPVFLLTLNQSSLHGWWKGLATALGAAIADTLYFLLAMFGILSIVESMGKALLFMEGISGILLVAFGIHLIRTKPNFETPQATANQPLILSTAKSFLITMLNPFMLFFFIFVSVHILPAGTGSITKRMLLLGSLAVGGGSLAILALVAALGSLLGSKIKRSSLEIFSRLTGVIFGGIGVYLLVDFVSKLL
jgi:threonine/homoserine/homoserine lactone efflux protein